MTTTIEEEIATWSATRPSWQQAALRKLAQGHSFDQTEVNAIVAQLEVSTGSAGTPLQAGNISGTQVTGATVQLNSVRDATNVNALLASQELTFGADGLTVIYGDNGSGKSGYARLIKSVVGARHQEPVHANVFADSPEQPQKAEVGFSSGGTDQTALWPDTVSHDLRAISFYDEACGEEYIGGDSELTYRPSALVLLDGLIALCGAVQKVLDEELHQNELASGQMPSVTDGTDAAKFLAGLSSTTTEAEIDAACATPPNAKEQLGALLQEEARLRATDPSKERARLEALATQVAAISAHRAGVAVALSDSKVTEAKTAKEKATELRAAATLASSETFDSEPVQGVGTETWRILWEAARKFSETEAYKEQVFPLTLGGARCVLCQQELSVDASGRLTRFQVFMRDTTSQQAAAAENHLRIATEEIKVLDPTPPQIAAHLIGLKGQNSTLAQTASDWLQTAAARKAALLGYVGGRSDTVIPALGSSPESALDALNSELRKNAAAIDATQFQEKLGDVAREKNELEGRLALSKHRAELTAEIKRRAERARLESAKRLTDTTGITRKSTELAEAHVTTIVRDRFTRESDRLYLERIELKKTGGQKGKLRHRPSLLGAKNPQPVKQVLSEGEQTALGLAGYFTEAYFDDSKSALVLDDPVTSLDHIRRSRVANRLAQLATERQVVVFTHDLTFVGDLATAAAKEQIAFTERSIERRGDKIPGLTTEKHPWKAKDVGRRCNELEQLLAHIKKERAKWNQDEYEKECAEWAGKLSETWERLINLEIVYPIVDPGTSHVQPRMFKILAQITDTDDQEFQQSYERCSGWVRRHDKSQATNYVAPEPSDLEQELAFVRAWFDRVKRYRQQ